MSDVQCEKPVLFNESVNHPHLKKQFEWEVVAANCQTALFAGQLLTIIGNNDGLTSSLTYLDMAHHTKFESMDSAKDVAASFAKAVLFHMTKMIDSDHKHLAPFKLTQFKVPPSEMDLMESTLYTSALFSREAGLIIDLDEAKEQIDDLNTILPAGLTIEHLDAENITYLELHL